MSWGYDLLQDAQRDAVWRWATRYTLSHSAMMIGDCDTIRKQAILFGMPEEHIVTFPWGIDLEHFAPPVQPGEDGRARSKPFTLLSARGWEPVYGVDIIVRAFILAIQRIPDLRLVMLGNGSQKPWVQKTFRQAGLLDPSGTTDTIQEPRVIFPGQIKYADLPRYYHSADLYVSASHSDGSSISLLEAMACGLPALVSDIPGNREWVRPGENGWLFPDGDADSLAQAILNAAAQHDRLPAMGEAACRTAQERADWRQNFQRLLEAFKRVYPEATHG
jgi:glycosyltransferase involved in cell wall biosynthesis